MTRRPRNTSIASSLTATLLVCACSTKAEPSASPTPAAGPSAEAAAAGPAARDAVEGLPLQGAIDTPIGPLAFEGGYPTDATVARLYDAMDFQRAVEAFQWAIPLVSFAKWQQQHETVFGQRDGDLVKMVDARDKMGMLTPNDSTTYVLGFLNLNRTGPFVIDYPKGKTAGAILDFWQRPITDMGLSGPDQGEGGKYLVVPPGHAVPDDADGYRVVQSPTNNLFFGFRVLVKDPEVAAALTAAYQGYPYSAREDPPRSRVIPAEGRTWTGWPESGMEYWELLARMLEQEPVHERDRMMVAMLRPLGIAKGEPFRPDDRRRRILTEAAAVGEAMARAQSFAKRQPEAALWPGTRWRQTVLLEANQETDHYTSLDERTAYFYEAVALSAGMTTKTPGLGQVYIGVQKDADGAWLEGGNDYTLRVPPGVPAEQFWALTLYDVETRSFIETEHGVVGRDSRLEHVENPDGSVDLYLGPNPPPGKESNWIPTAPGRGWFALFRLYAPTQAYFDRSWSLPDVVRVER